MPAPATQIYYCQYCGSLSAQKGYCCQACEILDLRVGPVPMFPLAQNPYSHYDQAEFREIYRHEKQKDYEYLFFAEGLHCTSCVHLLEKLPQFYSHITHARVNFAQSTVGIKLSSEGSLAQAAYVIQELGYKPSLITKQEDLSEKHRHENRAYLKRIAVAGFCAGNIMLFVIPVYAGLSGSWALVFNWISFLLFLPILLFSATPFYRGAWNSLKFKVINVDLPIVIAMISGFVLSTVNLIRGSGEIYFDSTASFLFFILSSRYVLKRIQQNYLAPLKIKSFFKGEKYLRLNGDMEEVIPASSVLVQDTLKIFKGQSLPSDAELLSSHALLDMSLFNGESLPRVFSCGMQLFAGTVVLDSEVLVRIKLPFNESRLGKLLLELEEGALAKSKFVALTDLWAQKLIVGVFGIAILFFLIYFHVDANEAFNRSLALIVLACPCALAFGSPLTFGLALKKAQAKGILLKDATSLERLLTTEHIFFDKTGTLTEGSLRLSHSEPAIISPSIQKIILSLEAPSYHPIAFALRQAWEHPEKLKPVTDFEEILGRGVRGLIEGQRYEVRHLSESLHESEIAIEVLQDGRGICRLYFSDALRTDSAKVVALLKEKGLHCHLLSGDKKSRVQTIAEDCGIPKDQAFAELFPEDKKAHVDSYRNTCMIGDGANDSLSLKAADVGIAVKGSVDLSLHSADVYFTRGGLTPLLDLLNLARQTRHVLIRNLSISLIYNVIGGLLALLGFIDPMMAAILMPVSSVAILLSSLWGFR